MFPLACALFSSCAVRLTNTDDEEHKRFIVLLHTPAHRNKASVKSAIHQGHISSYSLSTVVDR